MVDLSQPDKAVRLKAVSPSGRVPVLVDGDVRVWESLAIAEYLAERFPDAGIWPADRAARAHARSVANEMHSGFAALRSRCIMNMRREPRAIELSDAVHADIRRVVEIWTQTQARFGSGGDFLYGAFSTADAMFAPIVSRFHGYAIDVPDAARRYMTAVMALPGWREWRAGSDADPYRNENTDNIA